MPFKARREVIDESTVGVYHTWSRFVRRVPLAAYDPATGRDFSHRKEWLRRRLELLVSIFAVECLDWTTMDNHLHSILRNRPDVVEGWTDEEVAERWLRLKRSEIELRGAPSTDTIAGLVADTQRMVEIRRRMSSISWFQAYWKEPFSRLCNLEDDVTGHVWSDRFGCRRLEDDAEVLVCSLYANMNPIRAGAASSIETAEHTSNHERLLDRRSGDAARTRSGWLAAVHVDGDGYAGAAAKRRASDKGYLWVSFDEYLELLDGLIRRERAERAGTVEDDVPPILVRLGISTVAWETAVRVTSRRFARDLEISERTKAEARRMRRG